MKEIIGFFLLIVLLSTGSELKAQNKIKINDNPSIALTPLPDGTLFAYWDDQTQYTKVYHVSQNNPKASDVNDGTEGRPFLTINRAAQVVKPGECVYIHTGVYRELVRPRYSGEGSDKMIKYQAAPGEKVVIKGSRVIDNQWILSIDPHDSLAASGSLQLNNELGFPANSYSKQIMMITLPDDMFENGYFPLKMANTTEADFGMMDWATRWKGRIPYILPRCLLFQNGKRMSQLAAYEDLVRLQGSYWVAPDRKTIHINAFDNVNPNDQLFEIATQNYIIQPETTNLGYIRISGLILEHCANGFLRSGEGALFTMGGHHWIIEGNTVREVNALGIEIGSSAYERRDPRNAGNVLEQGQRPPQQGQQQGGHIVRRNVVYNCGTAGIRGLGTSYALVEENNINNCGWQDAEFHWEVAGIKLLFARETLVRNNYISNILGGCGIWLDVGNQNSRVTRNVIRNITTLQGAIYIEASQVLNLVDNNIMWNITGQGVRLADTDNTIVTHNLFANVTEEQVVARVATDRIIGGRKLTSTGNQILNNIIVNQGKPIQFTKPGNVADYNIYISTIAGKPPLKDSGTNSKVFQADVTLDEEELLLSWKAASDLPSVPMLKSCELDFFNNVRTSVHNVPGPFQGFSNPVTIKLFNGFWNPSKVLH